MNSSWLSVLRRPLAVVSLTASVLLGGCGPSNSDGTMPTGTGGTSAGTDAATSSGGRGTGGESPGSGGAISVPGTGGQPTTGATGGAASTGGSGSGGSVVDAGVTGGRDGGTASGGVDGGTATGGKSSGGAGGGAAAGTGGATGIGGTAGGLGSSDGKKPITIWMAGDSTMDTGVCTGCGNTACGWGGQFDALFNSNVTVVNRGKSGASIQTWLYGDANVSTNKDANGECVVTTTAYDPRWTGMLDANTGMKPGDYLWIEFGINDDGTVCNRRVGKTLYQKYLAYMADQAKARGAQAIFGTATAALECSGSVAQISRNFITETMAAGTANNVPVINMTKLTADLYTSLGFCPDAMDYTSSSKIGQFFCNDHTHFEKLGAQQIAQVAAKALKTQGIGLAAYLIN